MIHEILNQFDPAIPIERALTPPSSWYTEKAVFDAEVSAVFLNTWQAVGHIGQLESQGQYFTGELAGQPYMVLRDTEDRYRSYYNVCRHHASTILHETGHAEELVCPYHGWTYCLKGNLKRAPHLGPVKNFRREDFGLLPIENAQWGPLVFLHFGKPDLSLAEYLQPLKDRINLGGLRFIQRVTYEIACNWKVYVDNYLDGGYHVNCLHPGLSDQLDLNSYKTEIFDQLSIQSCSDNRDASSTEGVDFSARVTGGADYVWIYPNLMLNRYGPILDTNLVLPLGPDKTVTVFDYYFEEPAAQDQAFIAKSLAASDQVQKEDIMICEAVQKGLESRGYDVGRYAPELEAPAHHFHRLLHHSLSRK